jgi:hypothetical protein
MFCTRNTFSNDSAHLSQVSTAVQELLYPQVTLQNHHSGTVPTARRGPYRFFFRLQKPVENCEHSSTECARDKCQNVLNVRCLQLL